MKYLISYLLALLSLASCNISSEKKGKSLDSDEKAGAHDVTKESAAKEVVCFVYHRFGNDRYPSTNISVSDFESHLKWLVEHNFQVLSLSDAIEYIKSDKPTRRTAVITIDDGYKSFSENGLPLLVKHNMPATLFINTETVGSADYMDWESLKEAVQSGIEIGNHTHSHPYFLNESQVTRYTTFVTNVERAQSLIEMMIGIEAKVFAYPYGEFDEPMKASIKALGFKGAAAQNSGIMNSNTDLYQIPRFPMSEAYSKEFMEKAQLRSFNLISQSPTQTLILNGEKQPSLTLKLKIGNLNRDQMQCFVQGSGCKLEVTDRTDQQLTLKLQSTTSILGRRRTLYTLTAPDSIGNWYWYSHLWVNPAIK